MKLKVLELFGGIGACTKALKRIGVEVEIVDYVEIDKNAVASYNAINGTNFAPQDVSKWDKDVEVDLIMHGSPCQDFSIAGLNKGGDEGSGTRSSLMYETIRIVRKLMPKYVIWENVKNLLSDKHIHNYSNYLEAMDELGYRSYYQVMNSKDYGIPQDRERIFTVSIRKDIENDFRFPKPIELKKHLKDMLEDNPDKSFYLTDEDIKRIAAWKSFENPLDAVYGNNSIVDTLTAGIAREGAGTPVYSEDLEETKDIKAEIIVTQEVVIDDEQEDGCR